MQFTRDPIQSLTVRQIEPGRIRIGDTFYEQTVAMTGESVVEGWRCERADDLVIADLVPLLERNPDVVIIGTGWSPALPPRDLTFNLAKRGIGLEVMDTPAACRTFNILVAEDRRPGALLFLR